MERLWISIGDKMTTVYIYVRTSIYIYVQFQIPWGAAQHLHLYEATRRARSL